MQRATRIKGALEAMESSMKKLKGKKRDIYACVPSAASTSRLQTLDLVRSARYSQKKDTAKA